MLHSPTHARLAIEQEIVDQIQAISPRFAKRAEAADKHGEFPTNPFKRCLPPEPGFWCPLHALGRVQ